MNVSARPVLLASLAIALSFVWSHPASAAAAGTLEMSATSYGAVQSLGVKITTVNRVGGSSGAVSVTCRTVNSTALAGRDYTALTRTLTWANGDATPKNCDIPIANQAAFNGSRTFFVELSNPSGATLGNPLQSTVVIYGNQPNSRVALSSAAFSVKQNAGSLAVTVTRTGVAGAASVSYATANSTAVAGADYTAEHGSLSWAAGDMSAKTIHIPISNAKPFSGAKKFALAIASPSGTSLGTSSAIVSINGDTATTTLGNATLSWSAPITNTNGAVLTNLAGFKVYYGTSPTALTRVVQLANPKTLTFEVMNLGAGTWFFSVVAYNAQGVNSEPSATGSKTI
jgi:hypothetical protein